MSDHLLVETLRERDPGAPAAVYDAHAEKLYAYCWFQLRGRDAAQVALRDTFIVAEAHIGKLREPDRFEPWLYAIARLECARRMPPRHLVPDVPVASHDQEDVDQRITAWQAVLGLPPLSRELLELHVRRRLSVPDLAAVFGLSPRDAQTALDCAHGELEAALTAEMLANKGPYGCPERAHLLRERQGDFTHDLSKRLMGHARECSACGSLRPRSVSAAKVYGLLPDAVPAPETRLRVMSCFLDPELVGYRLFVATRVTEFRSDGFPVQSAYGRPGRAARQSRRWRFARPRKAAREERGAAKLYAQVVRASAALVVVALLSASGVASMYVVGAQREDKDEQAGPRPTAIPGISQRPGPVRKSPVPPQAPGALNALPMATFPLGAQISSAPLPALLDTPSMLAFSDGAATSVAAGVLTVSPLFLDLAGGSDGSIELKAEGGPVTWQAKGQDSLKVSPSSGSLGPGQSVTVHVHVSRQQKPYGDSTLTFRPGGTQVHVTWRSDTAAPTAPPEAHRPASPAQVSTTSSPSGPPPADGNPAVPPPVPAATPPPSQAPSSPPSGTAPSGASPTLSA
ncbi:DNA-directed RNA polymerase specialized sigma subunit, sigma24 family [Actinomadura glauciflava]|uniref:hypothetical protein n=1 Tax=Actinomadura luteofluorescens TaxID=46163 RepID=UPI0021647312|nr:hypothetical protein [Actinomadura glauciflava]MCR3745246.1 DNA-directed RNA polymerase specialized sigma subunit, sigma24 family [Actinomadura glauciflava]